MNDVRYHTFLDEVTTDHIYRCSYYQCMISLDNLQHRTITKIAKQTKIQGITYKYIRSNAIPLSLSLNRCVFDVTTGIGLYSRQGIIVYKVMESNNLVIGHKHSKKIYLIERFIVNAL
jgi:hypothetical protein